MSEGANNLVIIEHHPGVYEMFLRDELLRQIQIPWAGVFRQIPRVFQSFGQPERVDFIQTLIAQDGYLSQQIHKDAQHML